MASPATPSPVDAKDRLFCAIDTTDRDRARALAAGLAGAVGGLKLGLEFFSAHGPEGVRAVVAAAPGARLFLDLKFHDIPNTVAAAMRAVAPLAPFLVNVHAAGGRAMMEAGADAAREAADRIGVAPPRVIAVTALTSLDAGDLAATGVAGPVAGQVLRLATLAREAGLDGVVCSGHEIASLRAALGADFTLVTPGIRPAGTQAGDQKRVMTPAAALHAGADFLVIGRPITAAPDPAAAARAIAADAAQA